MWRRLADISSILCIKYRERHEANGSGAVADLGVGEDGHADGKTALADVGPLPGHGR